MNAIKNSHIYFPNLKINLINPPNRALKNLLNTPSKENLIKTNPPYTINGLGEAKTALLQ